MADTTETKGERIPLPEKTPEEEAQWTKNLLAIHASLEQTNPVFYWKDMYKQERDKHYRLHHPEIDLESSAALHPHQLGCIHSEEV
jgi:hypothetical protein